LEERRGESWDGGRKIGNTQGSLSVQHLQPVDNVGRRCQKGEQEDGKEVTPHQLDDLMLELGPEVLRCHGIWRTSFEVDADRDCQSIISRSRHCKRGNKRGECGDMQGPRRRRREEKQPIFCFSGLQCWSARHLPVGAQTFLSTLETPFNWASAQLEAWIY